MRTHAELTDPISPVKRVVFRIHERPVYLVDVRIMGKGVSSIQGSSQQGKELGLPGSRTPPVQGFPDNIVHRCRVAGRNSWFSEVSQDRYDAKRTERSLFCLSLAGLCFLLRDDRIAPNHQPGQVDRAASHGAVINLPQTDMQLIAEYSFIPSRNFEPLLLEPLNQRLQIFFPPKKNICDVVKGIAEQGPIPVENRGYRPAIRKHI